MMRWLGISLVCGVLHAGLPDIRVVPADAMRFPAPAPSAPGAYLWWYGRVAEATRPSGCVHSPSCSRYGTLAVREYGPWLGILLATDRLYREPDDVRLSLRVRDGERLLVHDPIDHNTFWWKSDHENRADRFYLHLVHAGWTGRLR